MDPILFGWPYAGLAFALLLLGALALERRPAPGVSRWQDPAFVLALLWPMYLVHQFEEHGVDFAGRHFAFLRDICANLGHESLGGCPADPAFIFVVNVVACPMAFVLPVLFRHTRPVLAAFGWSIPLVNAFAHIGGAVIHGAYNPGLGTSLLLFVPLGAWMIRTMLRAGLMTTRQVPLLFACGGLLHAVLMGSLLALDHGLISRGVMLAINAVNGLLPLGFGLFAERLAPERARA